MALRLFDLQFRHNTVYRRLCSIEKRSPDSVRHWKEVPAMPGAGFRELVLTTFPVRRARRVFKTSGTTAGSRGAHFFETLKFYREAVPAPFRRYLLPDRARCRYFFLMPSPAEAPESSLSFMMGEVRRVFGEGRGKFYVRRGKLDTESLYRDLAREKGRAMILSTAFSMKIFLDELAARHRRLSLASGSRLMETGGFKGRVREISKKDLYDQVSARLGIEPEYCVSEYGMTELSSQFYDTTLADRVSSRRRRPVKAAPAWMRTVVIDPLSGKEAKAGKKGLLRHYDLANRGSVMAVQTEDLGIAREEGFDLLGRAPGSEIRGCSMSYEEFLQS